MTYLPQALRTSEKRNNTPTDGSLSGLYPQHWGTTLSFPRSVASTARGTDTQPAYNRPSRPKIKSFFGHCVEPSLATDATNSPSMICRKES